MARSPGSVFWRPKADSPCGAHEHNLHSSGWAAREYILIADFRLV